MQFDLGKYVTYEPNKRVAIVSLGFSIATFAVYGTFFDILAPFIPGGSVRFNSGTFFLVPVFLLLSGQTLFVTWLVHVAITMVAASIRDFLKAYLVASVHVFLFSIFYVLYPHYGPYTFIVYFMPNQNFAFYSYPPLIIWTTFTVLATYIMIKRIYRLENSSHFGQGRRLLLAASMLALTMVMAS
jgi:hypothetical protein